MTDATRIAELAQRIQAHSRRLAELKPEYDAAVRALEADKAALAVLQPPRDSAGMTLTDVHTGEPTVLGGASGASGPVGGFPPDVVKVVTIGIDELEALAKKYGSENLALTVSILRPKPEQPEPAPVAPEAGSEPPIDPTQIKGSDAPPPADQVPASLVPPSNPAPPPPPAAPAPPAGSTVSGTATDPNADPHDEAQS